MVQYSSREYEQIQPEITPQKHSMSPTIFEQRISPFLELPRSANPKSELNKHFSFGKSQKRARLEEYSGANTGDPKNMVV